MLLSSDLWMWFKECNLLKVIVYVLAESGFESGPVCSRAHFNHDVVLT